MCQLLGKVHIFQDFFWKNVQLSGYNLWVNSKMSGLKWQSTTVAANWLHKKIWKVISYVKKSRRVWMGRCCCLQSISARHVWCPLGLQIPVAEDNFQMLCANLRLAKSILSKLFWIEVKKKSAANYQVMWLGELLFLFLGIFKKICLL